MKVKLCQMGGSQRMQLCQMGGSQRKWHSSSEKPETNLSTVGLKVKLVLFVRSETITLGSRTL